MNEWAVVDTDNFDGDYPNEKFVGPGFRTKEDAQKFAAIHNDKMNDHSLRYHKVVRLPYKLQPGFEP